MSHPEKYNLPLRILHWFLGFAVLGMLASGFVMTNYLVPPLKFAIYGQHKAVGVTLGTLMIVRLIIRLFSDVPAAQFSKLEAVAMRIVHFLLYIVTIGAALSGYLMSSSAGKVISWFGLFNVPLFPFIDGGTAKVAHSMHQILVYVLPFLIGIHILATFKHLVMNKRNLFRRMF